MQLEYNGIGTLCDWNTMKLGPKWELETMGQGHNEPRIQRVWNTMGLEHRVTGSKMGARNDGTGTKCD